MAEKRSILVVDEELPIHPADGGAVRMARLLEVLAAQGCAVTAAAPGAVATADHRRLGIDVIGGPLDEHLRDHGERYDTVILSRPATAATWMPAVRRHAPHALLIYDTLDLHFVREFRHAKLTSSASRLAHALDRKRQELALVRSADRTLVVSEAERATLAGECPDADVHVVSNIHPVAANPPPFEARNGVVFVGAFGHSPNIDAAAWLRDEVWPLVRAARPLALTIVGRRPPAGLDGDGIAVAASVADVAPYIDAARLSIAPLRFGAGVKGKVLESMGRGTPVVGTAVAFEGIPWSAAPQPGADAAALAQAVLDLHDDRARWERLAAEGQRIVTESFSVAAAARALTRALAPRAVHA